MAALTDNPTPQEVLDMRAKALLASSMPELGREFEGMRRSTMTKVFQLIRQGQLTPDQAMSYWMEMYSYDRLESRLRSQAAGAAAVTEKETVVWPARQNSL